MNERRQRVAERLHAFLHRHSGKLYLSSQSTQRMCADARLLVHELDRAIDDLFFLCALEVKAPDDLTHVLRELVPPSAIAWQGA